MLMENQVSNKDVNRILQQRLHTFVLLESRGLPVVVFLWIINFLITEGWEWLKPIFSLGKMESREGCF